MKGRREWRFFDETATEQHRVPQNWIEEGYVESVGIDLVAVYPILVRGGVQLLWTVRNGTPYDGPHRERLALDVLYVTEDATDAIERVYPAVKSNLGVRPRDTFVARASVRSEQLEEIESSEKRDQYASLVDELRRTVGETMVGPEAADRIATDGGADR